MILNDELNVSLLNDIECVQTFISVFHLSTFKYNKSVDTNIYLQAHGVSNCRDVEPCSEVGLAKQLGKCC